MKKQLKIVALASIVVAGFILRIYNLDSLGLWADEGTVYIASKNILNCGAPLLETGLLYARDYPHLYLTALSLQIFGHNEFALRLPSVIFGTALIVVVYFLTKELFEDDLLSLLAAGTIAVHPWLIEYSRYSRSYMMMVCLLYLTVFFCYKIIKKDDNYTYYIILFSVTGFFTTLTHQIGQIVIFLLLLLLLDVNNKKRFFGFAAASISLLSGVLIYRCFGRIGYLSATDQRLDQFLGQVPSLVESIPFGFPNVHNLDHLSVIVPGFWLMSLVGILFIITEFRNKTSIRRQIFIVSIFIIFIGSILCSKELITINRALLFLFPLLVVLTLYAVKFILEQLSILSSNQSVGIPTSGIMIVFCLIMVIFFAQIGYVSVLDRNYGEPTIPQFAPFEGFIYYPDHKTTVEFVDTSFQNGDVIVLFGVPQYWELYSKKELDYRVWTGTTYTVNSYNVYTGIPEVSDLDVLKEIINENERVWIVTSFSIFSDSKYGIELPRINHIKGCFVDYLSHYDGCVVYRSGDPAARAYLIENNDNTIRRPIC